MTKSKKNHIFNQSILTQADLLAERNASYVSEFVTRANDDLYAILADIFQFCEQVESSKQRQALIKSMREHLRENYGIKTQANTKTTALVTKYVTRAWWPSSSSGVALKRHK